MRRIADDARAPILAVGVAVIGAIAESADPERAAAALRVGRRRRVGRDREGADAD